MPYGIAKHASPVVSAIQGFDRPNELFCVVGANNEPVYFGYHPMCEFYVESKAPDMEIKPLNAKTGKPFDYIVNVDNSNIH